MPLPSSFTAELFVLAVDEWVATLQPLMVLVPDNASVHRDGGTQAKQAQWAAQGLTRLFLSHYSLELNRVEILWRFCKRYGLLPAAYETPLPLPLLLDVANLLQRIGLPDYQVTVA